MSLSKCIEAYTEQRERYEVVFDGQNIVARSIAPEVGLATRVFDRTRHGHAAVKRVDEDGLSYCCKQAGSKVGLTISSFLERRLVDHLARTYSICLPLSDIIDTSIIMRYTEKIAVYLSRAQPRVSATIQAFCEVQLIGLFIVGESSRYSHDQRIRWGMSIDLTTVSKDGRRCELERSCGGTGRPDIAQLEALSARINEELAELPCLAESYVDVSETDTLIFSGRATGMLFHEIVGHACEMPQGSASSCVRVFGQEVGPTYLNVVDDPTVPSLFGTRGCDDVGLSSAPTPLLSAGKAVGLLIQEESPMLPGEDRPCARRENFRFPPMPRISNTVVSPSSGNFEEFCSSVRRGLAVLRVSEGSFDTKTHKYCLRVQEAYLVEEGHITRPVKPFILNGQATETLARIEGLGQDLSPLASYCERNGMVVPVGTLAPSLLVVRPASDVRK